MSSGHRRVWRCIRRVRSRIDCRVLGDEGLQATPSFRSSRFEQCWNQTDRRCRVFADDAFGPKRPSRRRLERAKTRLPRSLSSSLKLFFFTTTPPQMTTRWCQSKCGKKKPVICQTLSSQRTSSSEVVVGKSLLLVVAPPRAAAAGNHRRFCRRGLKSSLKEVVYYTHQTLLLDVGTPQNRRETQQLKVVFVVRLFVAFSLFPFSLQSLFFLGVHKP